MYIPDSGSKDGTWTSAVGRVEERGRKPKHQRKNSKKKQRLGREEKNMAVNTMIQSTATTTTSTWTVSGTSQWQYPADILVHNNMELRQLENFIRNKVYTYVYVLEMIQPKL